MTDLEQKTGELLAAQDLIRQLQEKLEHSEQSLEAARAAAAAWEKIAADRSHDSEAWRQSAEGVAQHHSEHSNAQDARIDELQKQIESLRVENAHLKGQLDQARNAAEYWRERHQQLREKQ